MVREIEALVTNDTRGIFTRGKVPIKDCGAEDVEIDIVWAGVCHSDYHAAKAEWPGTNVYPMVPGHEIAGYVVAVGENVTKFKEGDRVGVGCFIDSCRECEMCKKGDDNYCLGGALVTYNAHLPEAVQQEKKFPTNTTYGGYSQKVVVDQNYVISIPENLPMEAAAPLLCAGITMYSPLVHFGAKAAGSNFHVGIVGLGGLGDMGVKLAKAMGCKVTVISSSDRKKEYVEKTLQVDFISSGRTDVTKNKMAQKHPMIFDLVLCTAAVLKDLMPYLAMVKYDGTFCILGLPTNLLTLHAFGVVGGRKRVVGSGIGGIRETQECLDFCAEHQLWSEVEKIGASEINRAFQELSTNSAAKQRFVIDVKNTLVEGDWEVDMEPVKNTKPHTVSPIKNVVGAENTAGKTYYPAEDAFKAE